jgi:hypothetical protein
METESIQSKKHTKSKIFIRIISILLVITVICIGLFIFRKPLIYPLIYPIDNVFDEMYFSGKWRPLAGWTSIGNYEYKKSITDCNFRSGVYLQKNWFDNAVEVGAHERIICYEKNTENTFIYFIMDFKEKSIKYRLVLEYSDTEERLVLQADYDVEKNTLTEKDPYIIEPCEWNEGDLRIEYYDGGAGLYSIISTDAESVDSIFKKGVTPYNNIREAFEGFEQTLVKDWTDANPNSRFSVDNMGKITIINCKRQFFHL